MSASELESAENLAVRHLELFFVSLARQSTLMGPRVPLQNSLQLQNAAGRLAGGSALHEALIVDRRMLARKVHAALRNRSQAPV